MDGSASTSVHLLEVPPDVVEKVAARVREAKQKPEHMQCASLTNTISDTDINLGKQRSNVYAWS